MNRDGVRYAFEHILAHLATGEEHDRLFDALEEKDFLARQAAALGGFRQGSADLEAYVLPVAIDGRDWPRFLRHAVVALGLRSLAEALADEEILGALVSSGQDALAADIVEQLPDPQRRLRARAVVVGARRRRALPPAVDGGSARFADELDAVAPPSGEAEAQAWLTTLRLVAGHLGPELQGHWGHWIARLADVDPTLADDAWSAVAESWLERDLGPGSGLWPAIAEMTPDRARRFLPPRLAASSLADATFLRDSLPPPLENRTELLHDVRLALLAAGKAEDPSDQDLLIDSVERVELGRELYPRLRQEQRERLVPEDPSLRAAFRVAVVEGLKGSSEVDADAEEAALAALDDLPQEDRLHWTLRCLTAIAPSRERHRRFLAAAHHFYTCRYDVDQAEDLARFVDLVAEELEAELPRVLPSIVAAPSNDADTLRALVTHSRNPKVLEELWRNAERYASAASENDGKGFQLRSELLNRLTGRLCVSRKSLNPYDEALGRVLPEEEDPLRLAVVEELAEVGERQLALKVCGELRSRRWALRTRLRLSGAGEDLGGLLQPAALYEAVAGSGAVADELAALAPLLELPERAGERPGLFLGIGDSDRRILALVDLARHDLAYQRRTYPPNQRDPVAALEPLSRAVGGTTSDPRLAALTPELAELGCRVSPSRALAELQEATLRLLRLQEVAWPLRSEALQKVLHHVESWVLDDNAPKERRQAVVTFFRWLARLPSLPELSDEELRSRWPEILSMILSAYRRLPDERRAAIQRHPFHPLDRWLPQRLVKRTANPWLLGTEGFAAWAPAEELASCFAARAPAIGEPEDETLVGEAMERLAAGELDPLDARSAPVRRALWTLDEGSGCVPLARATVKALSGAGRDGGERTLCFWIHGWVQPQPGDESQEGRERLAVLKEALRQAETIPGLSGAPANTPEAYSAPTVK